MAKIRSHYVCQSCGSSHPRWAGKCDGCGEWNTLQEEVISKGPAGGGSKAKSQKTHFVELDGKASPPPRVTSDIQEFDRVCGGGLVPGSALLIGGDPGIGKSTLLLQAMAKLAAKTPCFYISGEESIDQIRLRARRLGLDHSKIQLAATTVMEEILGALSDVHDAIVVIDSIQTMHLMALDSAPGTVGQVRASSGELIRLAKKQNLTMLIVGHVTKDGAIAGPKVLEHMVDTVLYFEGERGHPYRILRAVKNRFGATDEIGVFSMSESGLVEVKNPSALFLSERRAEVTGSTVFAGIEGTRPILVEVQALLASSPMATPRRTVIGWDSGRLAMILAVLESRCKTSCSQFEVYLNIAGGLKITETAADLSVAAALISFRNQVVIPGEMIFIGEIGLSGEIRAVSQLELRLKEAAKLGFTKAMIPKGPNVPKSISGIECVAISELYQLIQFFEPANPKRVTAHAS